MSVQINFLHAVNAKNARITTSHNPEILHEAYPGADYLNGRISSAIMLAYIDAARAEKHKQSIEPHQQLQE